MTTAVVLDKSAVEGRAWFVHSKRAIAPGHVTYEPKDNYIVEVTLDGLGSRARPPYV